MAETRSPQNISLYITHVVGDGPFLKIYGQLDKATAFILEKLILASRVEFRTNIRTIPDKVEGVLCIAKCKNNLYYRVRILHRIDQNLVKVKFVDYGKKEDVPLANLKFLKSNNRVLQMPEMATSFYLYGFRCARNTWEPEDMVEIKKILECREHSIIHSHTSILSLISIEYMGGSLVSFLALNGYGILISIQEQEEMLLKLLQNKQQYNINANSLMDIQYPVIKKTMTLPNLTTPLSFIPTTSGIRESLLQTSSSISFAQLVNYPPPGITTISNIRMRAPETMQLGLSPSMYHLKPPSNSRIETPESKPFGLSPSMYHIQPPSDSRMEAPESKPLGFSPSMYHIQPPSNSRMEASESEPLGFSPSMYHIQPPSNSRMEAPESKPLGLSPSMYHIQPPSNLRIEAPESKLLGLSPSMNHIQPPSNSRMEAPESKLLGLSPSVNHIHPPSNSRMEAPESKLLGLSPSMNHIQPPSNSRMKAPESKVLGLSPSMNHIQPPSNSRMEAPESKLLGLSPSMNHIQPRSNSRMEAPESKLLGLSPSMNHIQPPSNSRMKAPESKLLGLSPSMNHTQPPSNSRMEAPESKLLGLSPSMNYIQPPSNSRMEAPESKPLGLSPSMYHIQPPSNLRMKAPETMHLGLSPSMYHLKPPSNSRMKAPESKPLGLSTSMNHLGLRPNSSIKPINLAKRDAMFEHVEFLNVGSVHKVYVNNVEPRTDNFAIVLVSDVERLNDLMSEINRSYIIVKKKYPKVGQPCLAKYSDDRGLARAIVTNGIKHEFKLYFVDFGDEFVVHYRDIFEMPEELLEIPAFAIKMYLSEMNCRGNVSLEKKFESLVADKELTLKVVQPDAPFLQCGEIYIKQHNILTFLSPKFKFVNSWIPGHSDEVFVTYVHSCREFYVQPASELASLRCVMNQVKAHCAISQCPSAVSVGSVCCALFPDDGNWYRACVLDCRGNKVLVSYVDYGNKRELDLSDLRTITPELMEVPVMAMKCALELFENRTSSLKEDNLLESHILEEILEAYVIKKYDEETLLLSLVNNKVKPKIHLATAMLKELKASDVKPIENEAVQGSTDLGSQARPETDSIPQTGRRIYKPSDSYIRRTPQENTDGGVESGNNNITNQNYNSSNEDTNSTSTDKRQSEDISQHNGTTHVKPKNTHVPFKHLRNPVSIHQTYSQYDIKLDTEYEVSVVWFATPSSFYVQMTSLKQQYNEMMNKVPELYKGIKPYKGRINEGSSVLAKFPDDGVLYRATVLSCQPQGKYVVQYVDYGNEFVVDSNDIWRLDEELMAVPRMAINCSLLGVLPPDGEWKPDSGLDDCFNAPTYQCVFQEIDGEKHYVSMWNDGVSVADILVEKELAVTIDKLPTVTLIEELTDLNIVVGQEIYCDLTQVDSYNKFYLRFIASGAFSQLLECRFNNHTPECRELMTLDELKEQLTGNKFIVYVNALDEDKLVVTLYSLAGAKINVLEPDEDAFDAVTPLSLHAVFSTNFGNALISHVNTLSSLYLQRAGDIDALAILLGNMFAFYEEPTSETLTTYEAGVLCAARSSDENWYRAMIKSVTETECEVQFLDYGNTEQVSKDSIKELDCQFHQPCAFALEVGLDLEVGHDEALSKLIEWTTNKEIQVSLSIGDNGWIANLQLNEEDLCLKLKNEYPISEETEQLPDNLAESPTSPVPNHTMQVIVSHIDSPGEFWLQNCESIDKINEMQAFLQTFSSDYKDVEKRNIGMMCIAKYHVDESWYRAEIVDFNAKQTTVVFTDFGNTATLKNLPGELKLCPVILTETEALCMKCSLYVAPSASGIWTNDATKYFTESLGDLTLPVNASIVLKDDVTFVDIFVNNHSLCDKLIDYEHACSRSVCGHLHNCFVSHVDSPDEFWVQLQSDAEDLKAMDTNLKDAAEFPSVNDKIKGVICTAKYSRDNTWYRAKILDVLPDGIKVLFIDYGNTDITTEIRSIPDEIKQKPVLAMKCALVKPGIEKWPENSSIFLTELTSSGSALFSFQLISKGNVSVIELNYANNSVKDLIIEVCQTSPQRCDDSILCVPDNDNIIVKDLGSAVIEETANNAIEDGVPDDTENKSMKLQSLTKCDNISQDLIETISESQETLRITEVDKKTDEQNNIEGQKHVLDQSNIKIKDVKSSDLLNLGSVSMLGVTDLETIHEEMSSEDGFNKETCKDVVTDEHID